MIWLPVYKMEEDGRSQSTSSDARHDYPNASAKTKGCIDIKLVVTDIRFDYFHAF